MRVLAITPIWPNPLEPHNAPYNVQQLRRLASRCELEVLATVPYMPGAALVSRIRGRSLPPPSAGGASLSALPAETVMHGVPTRFVRPLHVPKISVPFSTPSLLAALVRYRAILTRADVILATWAYPTGCAAVIAARALGKPCVVKVHGSDINVGATLPVARQVLAAVLPRADAVVTMSRPLGDLIATLGVARSRIEIVGNGVDTELFQPRDRGVARRALGVPEGRPLILFVGLLDAAKGVPDLLEAMGSVRRDRPGAMIAFLGDGPARPAIEAMRATWGDDLYVLGERAHADVATWMTASDVLALPSHREGTPNAVLESLASGRPVVATRVGGIPDALDGTDAGFLVSAGRPDELGAALARALERRWDPAAISAAAPGTWDESAAKLYRVLLKTLDKGR